MAPNFPGMEPKQMENMEGINSIPQETVDSKAIGDNRPDDFSIANGEQIIDAEAFPEKTEVLDAYGDESGAEIQCKDIRDM